MKTKKLKPILIQTEKLTYPNCLWIGRNTLLLRLDLSYGESCLIDPLDHSMIPQQLILITQDPNDDVKDGDLMYKADLKGYEIIQDGKSLVSLITGGLYYHKSTTNPWYADAKKVVVTHHQLPLQYLQYFIHNYNNDIIHDVEIVMDCTNTHPILTNGYVTIITSQQQQQQSESNFIDIIEDAVNHLKTINPNIK